MKSILRPARLLLPLLALLATSGCESAGPITRVTAPPTTGRALVWSEDFTGGAGSLPNSAHWTFDVGTDWGNSQLEYDTNRATNVSLDGLGSLAITARRESYLGAQYTSGRITTKSLFSRAKGRFEARIKLPAGRGMWPAFWLLGANIGTTPWPGCGEIDIMEYRGQEPNIIHGSLHGPGYSGGGARTQSYALSSGTFDAGFHVFAVEWETNKITYLVDSVPYEVVTPANIPSGSAWVFEQPFFIILNLAVGGSYVGDPDGSTVFPQTMLVDYVRVYQAKS